MNALEPTLKTRPTKLHEIESLLGDNLDYSEPARSFSPCFSEIGLGFDQRAGIAALWLQYNRAPIRLREPFLRLPATLVSKKQSAFSVEQFLADGTHFQTAFFGKNAFLIDIRFPAPLDPTHTLSIPLTDLGPEQTDLAQTPPSPFTLVHQARLPTGDKRDPDKTFPLLIGLRVIRGSNASNAGKIFPDNEGRLVIAIIVSILETHPTSVATQLAAAPTDIESAIQSTHRWLVAALGSLSLSGTSAPDNLLRARAAHTLLSNATQPPGNFRGRTAAFPNRGHYATHFLWDTCFQNLALEHMAPGLAEDSLLILLENLGPDGQMPFFLCSTWSRPGDSSQPPLVGWAALRLVRLRGDDPQLADKFWPALARNNHWWLTHRLSSHGLLFCTDPFETGWDDTPRLDHGPILPCDMNAYLLLQMQATAKLAALARAHDAATHWTQIASDFAKRLVALLHDPIENSFYDAHLENAERIHLKTPANFTPLLADLPLSPAQQTDIIHRHLLDPSDFFRDVPWPSISYNHPAYQSAKWWRGPMWPSMSWLLLEVLARHNFHDAWRTAAERIYHLLLRDGQLHEHFDSKTGQGLGSPQQGWTAAIALRLSLELSPSAP